MKENDQFSTAQPHLRHMYLRYLRNGLIVLLLITLPLVAGLSIILHNLINTPNANGISATLAPDGKQLIGISDGSYAFDTNRPDGNIKQQASTALKSGDVDNAKRLWNQAVSSDTNDAESLIYLEDQRVLASHQPYITIVVGITIVGQDNGIGQGVGQSDLQGAYVAQKESNDGLKLPHGILVRLLIASSGDTATDAMTVAKQIVQAAKADNTIVGVMGWPISDAALQAIPVLVKAHIPTVSESASDDKLTGISPYFFRVVPPNSVLAASAAKYAQVQLHAKTVAVFVDHTNTYSNGLAAGFVKTFANGSNTYFEEKYTVKNPIELNRDIQDLGKHTPVPNLIFFSGYAQNACTLLADLPTFGQFATLPVLGGEALYEQGGYQATCRNAGFRLHFLAYTYFDEWSTFGLEAQQPAFFADYGNYFDPNKSHLGQYNYTRADNDPILSYDAMQALLQGSSIALSNKQKFTLDDLRKALTQINGAQSIQGVSGQISFGTDGNPIQKALLTLSVGTDSQIKMAGQNPVDGIFLKPSQQTGGS